MISLSWFFLPQSSGPCSTQPVQTDLFRYPVQDTLFMTSCPSCPVLAALPWPSYHGCPVQADLSMLSCSASLSSLSCTGFVVPTVNSCRPTLADLSWLFCPGCPVLAVLSLLFYPGSSVLLSILAVMF
jgi:hypothetical protein